MDDGHARIPLWRVWQGMGFESRDYARSERQEFNWDRRQGWSAVKWIIVICAVTFVIQLLAFNGGKDTVTRLFDLAPEAVFRGQIWRVVTYAFLHDPSLIWHILFNMLVLGMVGPSVETLRGSREFLAFYLIAAGLSGLAFLGWGAIFQDVTPAVGASGSVMATMIYYAMKYPKRIWYIYGIIPVTAYWLAIITIVVDLGPMLLQLAGRGFDDNIGHSAHLGGALFGYLYYRYDWWVTNWWPTRWGAAWQSWRSQRRRKSLKVFHPESEYNADEVDADRRIPITGRLSQRTAGDMDDAALTAQADRILQKLGEQGEQSLSDEERAILAEESRRARVRQSRPRT